MRANSGIKMNGKYVTSFKGFTQAIKEWRYSVGCHYYLELEPSLEVKVTRENNGGIYIPFSITIRELKDIYRALKSGRRLGSP